MSLRIGAILYGNCEGWFGKNCYNEKRVEAIGVDWVVARDDAGDVLFANLAESEGWCPDDLEKFTTEEAKKELYNDA